MWRMRAILASRQTNASRTGRYSHSIIGGGARLFGSYNHRKTVLVRYAPYGLGNLKLDRPSYLQGAGCNNYVTSSWKQQSYDTETDDYEPRTRKVSIQEPPSKVGASEQENDEFYRLLEEVAEEEQKRGRTKTTLDEFQETVGEDAYIDESGMGHEGAYLSEHEGGMERSELYQDVRAPRIVPASMNPFLDFTKTRRREPAAPPEKLVRGIDSILKGRNVEMIKDHYREMSMDFHSRNRELHGSLQNYDELSPENRRRRARAKKQNIPVSSFFVIERRKQQLSLLVLSSAFSFTVPADKIFRW